MNRIVTSRSRSLKLIAAGVAVALAGAFSITALAQPQGGAAQHTHSMMGRHGGHDGMGRMLERMLDGVNASEAQRAQIKQIAEAAAADLKTQRESARSLREQSMQLLTQPNVDANAAEALRQQMLAQHDQASRRMMQAMLDASRVLTPEQRAQLAERMKQRREMHERHRQERRAVDAPRS